MDVFSSQDRLPGGGELWGDQPGPGRWTEWGGGPHFPPLHTFRPAQPGFWLSPSPGAQVRPRGSQDGAEKRPELGVGDGLFTRMVGADEAGSRRGDGAPRVAGPALRCTLPPSAG